MKDINFANCFEGGTEIENLRFNRLLTSSLIQLKHSNSIFSFYEYFRYCLELLKTDFDLIVSEERRAIDANLGEYNKVSSKRVVQGVSESCDVCDATLFNLHL